MSRCDIFFTHMASVPPRCKRFRVSARLPRTTKLLFLIAHGLRRTYLLIGSRSWEHDLRAIPQHNFETCQGKAIAAVCKPASLHNCTNICSCKFFEGNDGIDVLQLEEGRNVFRRPGSSTTKDCQSCCISNSAIQPQCLCVQSNASIARTVFCRRILNYAVPTCRRRTTKSTLTSIPARPKSS